MRDVLQNCKLKLQKRRFCAGRPPKITTLCDNEAFVGFCAERTSVKRSLTGHFHCGADLSLLHSRCADSLAAFVKTKLSSQTYQKKKVKLEDVKSKLSSRARPPSKSESCRCENDAFARDVRQQLEVEIAKMTLSCTMSSKKLQVAQIFSFH